MVAEGGKFSMPWIGKEYREKQAGFSTHFEEEKWKDIRK